MKLAPQQLVIVKGLPNAMSKFRPTAATIGKCEAKSRHKKKSIIYQDKKASKNHSAYRELCLYLMQCVTIKDKLHSVSCVTTTRTQTYV